MKNCVELPTIYTSKNQNPNMKSGRKKLWGVRKRPSGTGYGANFMPGGGRAAVFDARRSGVG